jgi:outer membrane murein-binding lipoprotein Lpp
MGAVMDIEIVKMAVNIGGYLVMSFVLIFTARDLARAFLKQLITAVRENTAAQARLAEKIDQLAKQTGPHHREKSRP